MPKPGFKSITISEAVYDKFNQTYQKNKSELTMKGVNSFAGYVTYLLEDVMKKDKTFARYAPKLEKVSIDSDRIILKDNIKNRIAEVAIQQGELYCLLCDEKDCVHVGYVFSLPDVYEILNSKGINFMILSPACPKAYLPSLARLDYSCIKLVTLRAKFNSLLL